MTTPLAFPVADTLGRLNACPSMYRGSDWRRGLELAALAAEAQHEGRLAEAQRLALTAHRFAECACTLNP